MVTSLLYALTVLVTTVQSDSSVLYFQSAQCEPCRQMEPALDQLRQQGWNIWKVDAPNELDLARRFQIRNLPTLVLLSGDKEVDRIVGAATYEQIQSRLARAAARNRSSSHLQSAQAHPTQLSGGPQNQNLLAQSQFGVAAPAPTHPARPTNQSIEPNRGPLGNNQPIVRGQSPGQSFGASNSLPTASSLQPAAGFSANQDFPMLDSSRSTAGNIQGLASNISAAQPIHPATFSAGPIQPSSAQLSNQNSNAGSGIGGVGLNSGLTAEAAIARAADATVRIKVEEPKSIAHGTGTIVAVHGSEGLVLTCGHLFRDMLPGSKLTVDMFAGTPRQLNVPAELIDFKAKEEDIALLAIKLPKHVDPVPILPRGETLQPGQRVFSLGCDQGNNPTRRDTQITRVNRYMGAANVEIEGAPAVGRSGGGLFDMQGRLIGVCNAACNEENEGIYAAAEVIYSQLARAGQSSLFQPSHQTTSQAAVTLASTAGLQGVDQASANWPEEDPRLTASSNSTVQPAGRNESKPIGNSMQQLICVIKDSSTGKDRVITINQPSPALLQAIEQLGQVVP